MKTIRNFSNSTLLEKERDRRNETEYTGQERLMFAQSL